MKQPELKQEQVIRAVLQGDNNAFVWIVNEYKNTVATICINMLKDRNLAEEVGQDVFVRLYKSLDSFRGESNLKTYISRIAMNLCLNKLKQQKKWWERFSHGEDDVLGLANQDKGVLEKMANEELLAFGLQKLNEKHRALVVLRMIEGLSVKETADLLKMKEGTVMSGTKRALDILKVELVKLGYDGR